jgi:hypothetical protein
VISAFQKALERCATHEVAGLWLNWRCIIVAWLALALGILSPPHGFGVAICWWQGSTGLPCIGCGLTRSLSCALRGMFLESFSFHPMGLPIAALFAFTAGQSLFPKSVRSRLAQYIQSRALFFGLLYASFVTVFVAFGVVRALLHLPDLLR